MYGLNAYGKPLEKLQLQRSKVFPLTHRLSHRCYQCEFIHRTDRLFHSMRNIHIALYSPAYQQILVTNDMFAHYSWAAPTRDQTAKSTVHAVWSQIIQTFGCPTRFHSDQGPNFKSDLMQQLCILYRIAKSRTTPYHPAGNGRVERMNQTLLNMLWTLETEKQSSWPEYLPELLQAYNNTVHSATGFAPSYLIFGRHLSLSVDVGLGVTTL